MHTQIKSIIIFPCSILSDDPSCTMHTFCLRCVSEPTASFRNTFISLVPSCPVSVSSFSCSPIDRPWPDTLASALIAVCDESNIFRLIKIGCTLPITSCSCERSFSTLRHLRNWLMSSMSHL